jgi:signal transduction histidine kinase
MPAVDGLIQTAVEHLQVTLRADVGFAAIAADTSDFRISQTVGIVDPRWNSIVVRPGLGLGGLVLASSRPMGVTEYAADHRISRDFVEIVSSGEGLRTVLCAPVLGATMVDALLYVGSRSGQGLGEQALDLLHHVGSFASATLEHERTLELERELNRLRERERLASALHDSVAQRLFAIGALAMGLRGKSDNESLLQAIQEIEITAGDARRELRETLLDLNDDSDNVSFHVQLSGELSLLESTSGCTTRLTKRGHCRQLPRHIERLLIDAAVEGTRNAIKHSEVRLVSVEVSYDQNRVSLAVIDTHAAVQLTPKPNRPSLVGTGTGLKALRTRGERLGGELTVSIQALGFSVALRDSWSRFDGGWCVGVPARVGSRMIMSCDPDASGGSA